MIVDPVNQYQKL